MEDVRAAARLDVRAASAHTSSEASTSAAPDAAPDVSVDGLLRTQINSVRARTAITQIRALRSIEDERERVKGRRTALIVFVAAVALIVFAINMSMRNLQGQWPKAFAWWQSDKGFRNNFVFPSPLGLYDSVTIPSVAVSAAYHPLSNLFALSFQHATMTRGGALFLLQMIEVYGEWCDFVGIHWSGSSKQLNYKYMNEFLPLNAAATVDTSGELQWGYLWAAWNAFSQDDPSLPANAFSMTFWKKVGDFQASPLVQNYFKGDDDARRFFDALFNGGLVNVAINYFSPDTNPFEVMQQIFGKTMKVADRKCTTSDRVNSGVSFGSAMAGAGLMVAPLVSGLLGLFTGGLSVAAQGAVYLGTSLTTGTAGGLVGAYVLTGDTCAASSDPKDDYNGLFR